MNKNPYLNAVYAGIYIALLVSIVTYLGNYEHTEPQILFPIMALSLFVLSASVMGYLFILAPAMMYIDGKKEEAVAFFLKTVGTFAGLCALLFALILVLY